MEITHRQIEIIEAAGKILTTQGVSRLTIKNLAFEMKFSESAIYRHFESKEKILLTMMQYLKSKISDLMENFTLTGNVENDFRAFFRKLGLFFRENPYFTVVVFSEGLIDENEQLSMEILGLMKTLFGLLHPIVVEGQNQQLFLKSISSLDLTIHIISTFKHEMFGWKLSKFESDLLPGIDKMCSKLIILLSIHK